jgi:hypothetical protein
MFDPKVGMFISQDPIGFEAGDANLYRYVGNGPTNAVDPSGLDYLYIQSKKRERLTGIAYWAFEPGEGIVIGNARGYPTIGSTVPGFRPPSVSWDVHLNNEFGGGVLGEEQVKRAIRKFISISDDTSLGEFSERTQHKYIREMLDATKKGALGDEAPEVRAARARVWLEQHPGAYYGPRPMGQSTIGAPAGLTEIVETRMDRIFRGKWIEIDQDWNSLGVAFVPKLLLAEKTASSTSRGRHDPRDFDDKKPLGSIGKSVEAGMQAGEWATNLGSGDFGKAVMAIDNSGPGYFWIFPAGDNGVPSGPALPYWTTREAKQSFDTLGDFTVQWGADTIIGGWIDYPVPKDGHQLSR